MTTTNIFPAAILFDHDGTLVDTEPVWAAARLLSPQNLAAPGPQDTLDCLGLSMQFTLDRLRKRGVNLPDEEINDRLVAKVREALAHQPVEFLPGIERFLSEGSRCADSGRRRHECDHLRGSPHRKRGTRGYVLSGYWQR